MYAIRSYYESSDSVILPYGTYEVVVTALGEDTLEVTVTLDAGNMSKDVVFPPAP